MNRLYELERLNEEEWVNEGFYGRIDELNEKVEDEACIGTWVCQV